MKAGFRQSMSWLHTWCGLTCGWLLCAIFLTGTLSVFREPITRWMEAGPVPASSPAVDTEMQAVRAQHWLAANAADARAWQIRWPVQRGWPLELSWEDGDGTGHEGWVDAGTGMPQPPPRLRETEGGRNFMSFHYTLHGGMAGYWLVGWITACMLLALVSGVVVHKRIFKDFFTFRPGKGQRSWLDAHNLSAVLTLPFLFMIGYTGLTFFYSSYLPWPVHAAYGDADDAYARYEAELAPMQPAPPGILVSTAQLPDLQQLLARAHAISGQPPALIVIQAPGTVHSVVEVIGRKPVGRADRHLLTEASRVTFDAASGALLQQHGAHPHVIGAVQVHETIEALHKADFGGWPMKWLYFISGLLGTAMIAIGTLLFSIKRRKRSEHEFGAATAGIYRCVEAFNVASLAGVALASIVYLHGNRLLPLGMSDRSAWEIRIFLAACAASVLHALWRPPRLAWIEQLWLAAALCLALPLVNMATTGQGLLMYLQRGAWQQAGVELVALAFGLMLARMALMLQRRWPRAQEAARPAKPPAGREPAYRWQVASRVLAASLGGYVFTAVTATALALLLPVLVGVRTAVSVLASSLLGFVLFIAIAVGVFCARSVGKVWLSLAAGSALMGLLVTMLQRG
ncbi:PepSY-associated TM helix domain-containing protein [Stenotrophomonas sp. C4297]|uniref:PepSY-associated TM helix domain-containing protein n=1 Tax=Stenotrophomonas sp. C4297 TaxID=3077847 RepID=UPI00293C1F3C|nr:PepSY-associated TM helix domain-containing protein [Stenotrophomonas sp. C4297]MDV3509236.1 PepSY-associated TM helix domain-containing protein [Stenotrophomonas sp. C4297]